MILTALGDILGAGERPQRDLVVAFFADEENGGVDGSHWMVDNHPELFAGATEAISEVGGYSIDVGGRRAYLLQTGEKALVWIRLTARGHDGARLARHPRQRRHQARRAPCSRSASSSGRVQLTTHHDARCSASCARCSAPDVGDDPDAVVDATGTAAGFLRAHPAHDHQPDGARRRLQAQRHPRPRRGAHRRAPVRRAGGRGARRHPRDRSATRSRSRSCTTTSASRCRSRAPWSTQMVAALGRHDPGAPGAPVPDERRHRQQGARRARHRRLRLRAAAAARPTSTSRRCSTASTSACRSTRSCSGARCWATCSAHY